MNFKQFSLHHRSRRAKLRLVHYRRVFHGHSLSIWIFALRDGFSRQVTHFRPRATYLRKSRKNDQNHGAPMATQIAPQPQASFERQLATSKVDV